uniref:Uncharacterized protein LOC105040380 n=1 Tax=Elaeis guineensis var. tenera TaxID=51953 RepID=A0A6I9QTS8_ELAGV|nr:uncharacterized protein LOC105040380 [Elaeis guineensis]
MTNQQCLIGCLLKGNQEKCCSKIEKHLSIKVGRSDDRGRGLWFGGLLIQDAAIISISNSGSHRWAIDSWILSAEGRAGGHRCCCQERKLSRVSPPEKMTSASKRRKLEPSGNSPAVLDKVAASSHGSSILEAPIIRLDSKVQQAKKFAVTQAQQEGCLGNYRSFDSPFGNYLVPVIPTHADLIG